MKNRSSSQFKVFAKKYRCLLIVLALLPITGMALFCLVFRNKLCDAGAWGSLIAGLFTYFGTISLGIFTFFHTWQQELFQASLREIKAEIFLDTTLENEFFIPYSENELSLCNDLPYKCERFEHSTAQGKDIEEWNFLGFSVRNINHLVNFSVKVVGIYLVNNEHKVQEVKDRIKIWASNNNEPIDYKQTYSCFVGCDAKILSRKYMESHQYSNWFIVFSMTDSNMKVKYVICDYVLGQTFDQKKHIISEDEYQKRIKAHGTPIILTSYNKQFFN